MYRLSIDLDVVIFSALCVRHSYRGSIPSGLGLQLIALGLPWCGPGSELGFTLRASRLLIINTMMRELRIAVC